MDLTWEEGRAYLKALVAEYGLPFRVETFWGELFLYLERLSAEAGRLRLTALSDPGQRLRFPVLESLILATLLPEGSFRVADLGSGAGVPGLVLKLVRPELEVVLYEAHAPRVTFLEETIALLGLSGIRVERKHLGREWPEARFPVVVSRGYGSAEKFAAQAARLLTRPGLAFYLWRNDVEPRGDPERHLPLLREVSFELPEKGGIRRLLVFSSTSELP
ncbi:16S rRNA (guanine(527)-N(7))-methyltransferase RsmG [Thermosulfurimonas sp. F29]|uniref:16S rRNA (guanine(527)-N(7))-methyltransferase RsmG n=1 Tax=Thermosulfurimonas sp. F29 TaxID=2867247 RepID=UPI001C828778|nr:RsmG family class I SAM-dependent methyltransferase [Thermosulfurimonas sp. F29]MBX6422987.1 class I SAM-dependent methyltransferase [Thermosulfurimonas sp. F29]